MKFKGIFIVFNAVVIFSFIFIFFLPLFVLGNEYSALFWSKNWPLAGVFALILAAVNCFFIMNWKLFGLLEKEDWPALNAYLSGKVFGKKRYPNQYIRLLMNTCLLLSDVEGMEKLEAELRARRPAALRKNAVLFGVGYILRNESERSFAFFDEFLDGKGVEKGGWIRFDYAFSFVLARKRAEALPHLIACAEGSKDAVLRLLSTYLLESLKDAAKYEDSGKINSLIDEGKAALKEKFSRARWEREVGSAKTEVQAVILSKLIDDATKWLYGEEAVS
jgi:hypothetical protein